MVPWASVGHRCHHIPICSNCLLRLYFFPATAYWASIAVSIANIVLALALGWHVLSCSTDNCFTVFLPLFASAAPLGNWALYRVGVNVFSYVNPPPPATTPFTQFAIAIGSVSITALILTFIIANGYGDAFVTAAASAIPLLYAIATYARVATPSSLTGSEILSLPCSRASFQESL